MIPNEASAPVDEFVRSLRESGATEAAVTGALEMVSCAEHAGLVPLFRRSRQTLAFRWPLTDRKVGGVFVLWAADAQLSVELRWLLYEPAFRAPEAGDELVERLESLPVAWIRRPTARGFPNILLTSLGDRELRTPVCGLIRWIVDSLAASGSPPGGDPFAGQDGGPFVRPSVPFLTSPEQVGEQIDAVIQGFVDHYQLRGTRTADGSFDIPRDYNPWLGRAVVVHLSREGAERTILNVVVTPDRLTPVERWADMLAACNEWHAGERWPKVYLREEAPGGGGLQVARLIAEASVDLKRGFDSAFLSDWISDMIGAAFDFWKWMTEVKGL